MKLKSILVKSMMAAAFTVTGLVAVGSKTNNAQAAVVNNDAGVVKVTYTKAPAISVWNNYENPQMTGQKLAYGTDWKVIKTAYDHNGNKWYDLGKNQWVMAKYTDHADKNTATATQAANASQTNTSVKTNASASASVNLSGSEASARAWIAARESGGSYSARNGQYIGKYQLSASYLNGDYSAANQDRVANNYVKSRYGSWRVAQSFWQSHGWY